MPRGAETRAGRREAAALGALAFLGHAWSFRGGYVLDDGVYWLMNPAVREPSRWMTLFWDPRAAASDTSLAGIVYRPVAWIAYGLPLTLTDAPLLAHAVDAALHAACAALLLDLLRRVLGAGPAAWWAALLFAWHPAQAQSVAYAGGRPGLLASLFTLLYLRFHADGRPAAAGAAVLLASFSKESAAAAPLLAAAYDRWRAGPSWAQGAARRYAPALAAAAVYLAARAAVSGGLSQRGPWGGAWDLHAGLALRGVAEYARMALWPFALREPYGYVIGPGFAAGTVLLAALALLAAAAAAHGLRRRAAWGLGAAWAGLALLPVSNLLPFGALAADRLFHAPAIGLALVAGAGLGRLRRSLLAAAGAALGLTALSLSLDQQRRWTDDFNVALEAAHAAPDEPYAASRLGVLYARWRLFDRAEALYAPGLRPDAPLDVRRLTLRRLGELRLAQGRPAEAVPYLREALPLYDRKAPVEALLARAEAESARRPRARR